ncbi:ATP-binding protein [Streptomyces collinus]|uniref:ATP-binding protein n=1 Tax=Streptomyces collinus TaxID=42684 RepID=UPI0010639782
MISHPSRHCTVELQALPSRIGQVRRIVSAQLRYWHLDPLIDRAALGVTELLSNVHRHARPDKSCVVELELLVDRLTVSVRDHDPRLPVVADAAEDAALSTCGRGLAMVAAMSESWGARPEGEDGKVVWFTLPATTTARPQPARSPRRTPEQQPALRRHPQTHPTPTPVTAAPVVTAPVTAPVVTTPVVTAPAPAVAHAAAAPPTPARSAVPG